MMSYCGNKKNNPNQKQKQIRDRHTPVTPSQCPAHPLRFPLPCLTHAPVVSRVRLAYVSLTVSVLVRPHPVRAQCAPSLFAVCVQRVSLARSFRAPDAPALPPSAHRAQSARIVPRLWRTPGSTRDSAWSCPRSMPSVRPGPSPETPIRFGVPFIVPLSVGKGSETEI